MRKNNKREWVQICRETPGISDVLDKLFPKGAPSECHDYVRQRKRLPKLTHRGRVWYTYNGVRYQTTAYRLAYIRHYGSIADDLDVAHMCNNGHCGNPNHLIALPRSSHRKFDASQKKWVEQIKAMCPTATGHYGTTPKGWVTQSRKPRRPKPTSKKG